MKFIYVFLYYSILELLKYFFLVIFTLTDENIRDVKNIHDSITALKISLILTLPLYIVIITSLTFFVKIFFAKRKFEVYKYFSLIISSIIYYYFDLRSLFFFIENWELKLLLGIVSALLILYVSFLIRKIWR